MNKFRAYWLFLMAALILSMSSAALAETPKSSAPDSKEVGGYTKKDGTKVKGYTRKKKEEKADAAKTDGKTEAKTEAKTETKKDEPAAASADKKDDNLVHVKGYTKKDGTKVAGYTRRKHADK